MRNRNMSMIEKIKRFVERPARLPIGIMLRYAHAFHNQKALVKGLYWMAFGKQLNLKNPKTFNEKTQWLKVYDHNPLYHKLVDKYEVKKIVAEKIGEEYIIPTLGVWNSFDEIDFNSLPNQFVLKTTTGGGNTGVVICSDKGSFNLQDAQTKLEASAKNDIYKSMGEWVYKDIIPRFIAEKMLVNDNGGDLADYKIFCFNGVPKILFYASNRQNAKHDPPFFDYYDMQLNKLDIRSRGHQNSPSIIKPFLEFEQMKELAAKLSKGIPFVRVDFYLVNNKIYFGELTFYHDSGLVPFIPEEWDAILGGMIEIKSISNKTDKVRE